MPAGASTGRRPCEAAGAGGTRGGTGDALLDVRGDSDVLWSSSAWSSRADERRDRLGRPRRGTVPAPCADVARREALASDGDADAG